MKSVIGKKLQEKNEQLDSESEAIIKNQLFQLTKKDSPVRSLMWKRLLAYIRLIRSNNTMPPVPPGFGDLTDELQSVANAFKRITIYNYSVFGEQYEKILDEKCRRPSQSAIDPSPSSSSAAVAPDDNGAGSSSTQSSNEA